LRKLGLIGGMSWISTRMYYEQLNRRIQKARGTEHSAPLLIESLDFAQPRRFVRETSWQELADFVAPSAQRLEQAGATAILIAANSVHRVYDDIQAAVDIPVIHVADEIADRVNADDSGVAALLGARHVMTGNFYRDRLTEHGLQLIEPEEEVVAEIDEIIDTELMLGKATKDSMRDMKTIITNLERRGAEAIILGSTELEMIVDVDANIMPIYDSTAIHCEAGAEWILGG